MESIEAVRLEDSGESLDELDTRLVLQGENAFSAELTENEEQPAEWLARFSGSPTALRLELNLFSGSSHSGHSMAECRLYGRNRVKVCKWNGWGYNDTYLSMTSSTTIRLQGPRYIFLYFFFSIFFLSCCFTGHEDLL